MNTLTDLCSDNVMFLCLSYVHVCVYTFLGETKTIFLPQLDNKAHSIVFYSIIIVHHLMIIEFFKKATNLRKTLRLTI